jgi:molybdopterin molybdotransferase
MAGLLPVADAIARIVEGVAPLPAEEVAVAAAAGRVLAAPLAARRSQPPFPASAMDGYAVRATDAGRAPARLTLIGTAAAGKGFAGRVGPGQAVRIFTGAPVPDGADAILIQENATADGTAVVANEPVVRGRHIRPIGNDFAEGAALLPAGRTVGMREAALAGAMGYGTLPVRRRPKVAIISTGDELVPPGAVPGPDQIVATNALAVALHVRSLGGEALDLGIVGDDLGAIAAAADAAAAAGADVVVTIGGASVGDHDLVQKALGARGMELAFWRIAMRPGKPLMFGRLPPRLGGGRFIGLPGNPASAIVTTLVFLTPLVDALLGRPPRDMTEPAVLGADVAANDGRQDYLRARLSGDDGLPVATVVGSQDSAMLTVLAAADCLLIRPPNAPAAAKGSPCRIIRLP